MGSKTKIIEADVVIAGTGPGGCAVAKHLSKKGKKVVMLEKGGDNTFLFGTVLGIYLKMEKDILRLPLPTKSTIEGENLVLANGVGGGTLLYAGSAFLPDLEYWNNVGVDIPQDIIDETVKETWATYPPEEYIGQGAKRIHQAANDIGYPMETCMRHVDFNKCLNGCPKCVMGCPRGAKWTARVFAEEAIQHGAKIMTHVKVTDVITENGAAAGVRAKGILTKSGKKYEVRAPVVVCSSGGVGTAEILKNSGFSEAGSWFSGDPTVFVFGFLKDGEKGNGLEHNMTMGFYDEAHHVIFCAMQAPSIAWHLQFMQDEPIGSLTRLGRFNRTLGMFAKCSDDGVGKLYPDGRVSKTYTQNDLERFQYGKDVCREIIVNAGCDPDDIHESSYALGHPSGSVRVGEILDSNLETDVKNLYCCDTSVTPGAPGRPPALTIVTLGKRLARRLEAIV